MHTCFKIFLSLAILLNINKISNRGENIVQMSDCDIICTNGKSDRNYKERKKEITDLIVIIKNIEHVFERIWRRTPSWEGKMLRLRSLMAISKRSNDSKWIEWIVDMALRCTNAVNDRSWSVDWALAKWMKISRLVGYRSMGWKN